jgi:hypothetical protein
VSRSARRCYGGDDVHDNGRPKTRQDINKIKITCIQKKQVQIKRLCFDKFRREQCSRELAPALQKGTEHDEQRGVAWNSLIDRNYLESYKKTGIGTKT